jgi:carbonic anhydrase
LIHFYKRITMADSWGYGKENGPATWGKHFPIADEGKEQSPIDIQLDDCKEDSLPKLEYQYDALPSLNITNTGNQWRVDYLPGHSSLSGGPLDAKFELQQMHAHWGTQEGVGSEHVFNGESFDGELHFVHYNTKYGSFGEAVDKPDGLGVFCIFIKVGDTDHPEFGKITDSMASVKVKGETSTLEAELDPAKFLPEGLDEYLTYHGSLTTPPCFEAVTFIIFNSKPITISKEQMDSMRALMTGTEEGCDCMLQNFRPVCPQGDRVVNKIKM